MSTATAAIASRLTLASALLLALAALALVPRGLDGARMLAAQDDPVRIADLALDRVFDAPAANWEIEASLAAGDVDLAQSFLALADARGVPVDGSLRDKITATSTAAASTAHAVGRFAAGFVTGEPVDAAGLAGTVAGDRFVFGDIRDVVRESTRAARGEKVDELILGLACAGLAVTAGTYATLGAAAPARAGLSLMKAVGKAGRMSARMMRAVTRPLHGLVDRAALQAAVRPSALLHPALAVRAARDAVKVEKLHGLIALTGDIGRIEAKAGTRAALDSLRLAENPRDVALFARLAAASGGKTRAIIKLLGRGAILLGFGLFQIASWIFVAALNLIGLCIALKRFVERTAMRVFERRRRHAIRRLELAAASG
jgi:hypothetical protein